MSTQSELNRLLEVVKSLIGPGGCPWDQQQTPESLCDYIIEEAFEMVEAIRTGDTSEAREELGDVLFLLSFVATLYEKKGDFSLEDSLREGADKMIRRHPHVFADTSINNREELMDNWEKIKKSEKKEKKRVYDSLPKGLPPLLKAYRINSKAARNKFTWETDQEALAQLHREWDEWQEALASGDKEAAELEFGDYIFSLVEIGRRHDIKANAALAKSNAKFLRRFSRMEDMAEDNNLVMNKMSLVELDKLWNKAKEEE